jgi:AAA+ ATPase superfamily predicted ATPase
MARTAPARNPFKFGPLALDEAFTNRSREIAELTSDIRNGQDVVLFAPRRFGKTSLLWRVEQELVTSDVLVAGVDLLRTPTREKLAEKLAATIHDDIASPLFKVRERLKVFASLRVQPTVTVDPEDGSVAFSFSFTSSRADAAATLEELLTLPGKLAASRGRAVALVLDEFQEIVEIDPDLIKLMRSVFQTQPEVSHIYLGSRRHMMRRIFSDENEPFWRSAKQMELGAIARDEFEAYARERFAATGKRISEATAGHALELTGGHPYATQELLYFTWEATRGRAAAGTDELERALEATLRSEHAHFSLLWERASRAQRVVLQALAAEQPGRPLSSEYRHRHGLPATATVQTALTALTQAETVERLERGSYAIAEPFLAEWIRRAES